MCFLVKNLYTVGFGYKYPHWIQEQMVLITEIKCEPKFYTNMK